VAAIEFFGRDRDLASIGVEHVQDFAHWLATRPNGRGGTLSSTTQAHYLTALSNLFRRAQAEGLIRGVNPVAALMDKPQVRPAEAPWLEVWEGALLLEAARTFPYDRPETSTVGERLDVALRASIGFGEDAEERFVGEMRAAGAAATREKLRAYLSGERIPAKSYVEAAERVLGLAPGELRRERGWSAGGRPAPLFHPMIATFLLTGGRVAEVLGLELGEVSLSRETITFRPNRRRRLKTRSSRRVVPLWPQLREILEPYLEQRRAAGAGESDLLFPSPITGEMLVNLRPGLDAIARRAGWSSGEIRPKAFRHTYASARLQTVEHGHPVAERTVAGELGHGGFEMVRRVYGHLGTIRHRSEVVEYRIEQHRGSIPAARLRQLLRIA
jgi:integrase